MQKTVLIFCGELDYIGGGEVALLNVIRCLKNDFRFICACSREGVLAKRLRQEEFEVLVSGEWNQKGLYFFDSLLRLMKLFIFAKQHNVHLVYANNPSINRLASRLAGLLNVPSIVHVHDIFKFLRNDRYLFGRAARVIVNAAHLIPLVEPFQRNVEVVYNGVEYRDKPSPDNGLRDKLEAFCAGHFVVAHVGSLVPKKGWDDFFRTAAILKSDIPNVRFLVIGADNSRSRDYKKHLKEYVAELGLVEDVYFTGFVDPLDSFWKHIDVLLFPVQWEAFGLVIIEAFAHNVPVVSSATDGPKEIIENGQTGFLVPQGDVASYGGCVRRLYEDKDLYATIQRNAGEAFSSRFTLKLMVDNIRKIFKNALNVEAGHE